MNFKKWLSENMAGTFALVSCKHKNNPNFQVWGAMSDLKCKNNKKDKILKMQFGKKEKDEKSK